jgi:urea transport system permease protein
MIIWVAVGGRGTLIGPVVGAFGVNWLQSLLTTHYPDLWILVLGGMFVTVVLFIPDGVVGTAQKLMAHFGGSRTPEHATARAEEPETVEAGRAP